MSGQTGPRLELDVRPATPDDEPAVLALLDAALAGGPTGQRSMAFFRWKHHENPFGPSRAYVAEHDGRLVGFRTFLRWSFQAGDRTVRAARAVDTATHPDFQGRGIFRTLTLGALEDLRADTDLVFNTPNGNSLPGYLKMGWATVAQLPIAIRVARPLRFAQGLRSVRSATTGGKPVEVRCSLPRAVDVIHDDAALQSLLDEVARSDRASGRLVTARTPAYLQWRYQSAPGLDYRALALHRNGELAGLAVGRPRQRGRLTELTLAELLVRPGDRHSAGVLLRRLARSGVDHVAAHFPPGTDMSQAAWRAGYLPAPGVGMTLVAHPLDSTLQPDPLQRSSWRLSLGDLEVF